ncbi:hypothetical protein ES705_28043 [subsurface metagenome]
MRLCLKLWCDHCQCYQWHVRTDDNLYRCLGCCERGDDSHLCIASATRVIISPESDN